MKFHDLGALGSVVWFCKIVFNAALNIFLRHIVMVDQNLGCVSKVVEI